MIPLTENIRIEDLSSLPPISDGTFCAWQWGDGVRNQSKKQQGLLADAGTLPPRLLEAGKDEIPSNSTGP